MENQPTPFENQSMEPGPSQPFQPAPLQPEVPHASPNLVPPKRSKKKGLRLILVALFVLAAAGAGYFFLIYLPNKPEVVFKKAVDSFAQSTNGYTLSGELDQGGASDPDYAFNVKMNKQSGAASELHISTFVQKPSIYARNVNNEIYVNFSGFDDTKKLATKYSNSSGEKGIQEYFAEFTDISGLSTNQDKWFKVGDYMKQQPDSGANLQTANFSGAKLTAVGAKENINNKQTRKYEVQLNTDAFKQLLGSVEKSAGVPILSGILPGSLNTDLINASVWVNLKTKTIEQITYEGRPFKDAGLKLTMVAADNNQADAPGAEKLTSVLNYGFVSRNVFSKQLQQGGSDADRERIADLKGIKTALEIFKAKNGYYPDRYQMSVNQDDLIGNKMKGADFEVFKDPNGKLIGRSGSQYAYVPTFKDDSESCGGVSGPACEKFFIVTTLDNGKEFQLNSD